MNSYSGSCHCGAIKFSFQSPAIDKGLRCNCSMCRRRGALMTAFMLGPDELMIDCDEDELGEYRFASNVARHNFCNTCGIYPFHQTMRKPGYYRVNLGCVDGIDSLALASEIFDGAAM